MKVMIAIPCMDMMNTDFVQSLIGMRRKGEISIVLARSSLVYDARNSLCKIALENDFDRILWLDSDMTFDMDLYERFSARLDEGYDIVTGLCFTRKLPFEPCIYKSLTFDESTGEVERIPYEDYPKDALFPVEGCGCAAVMMNVDIIRQIGDKYGPPFYPQKGWGEDLTFCWLLQKEGIQIWCDSSIKLGHVGYLQVSEDTYLATRQHYEEVV